MNKQKENINLLCELWSYVEERKKTNKTALKIYNWLNNDNLSDIIIDNNVYWFELTSSRSTMPNYIYKYIKNFCNKKGFIYLYDIQSKY